MVIKVAWQKYRFVFHFTASQPSMGENNLEYMGSAESHEIDAIILKPGEHFFYCSTKKSA